MNRVRKYWDSLPPATRLAAAYVGILMLICLLFSVSMYQLAQGQLVEGLRHQYLRLHQVEGFFATPPSPEQINADLAEARQALVLKLIYFNLAILVPGSLLSYWLAKRTLRPIEEALEAQSRFAADASHELRTPLAVMQAEIEVARRNRQLTRAEALEVLDSNLEEVVKLRTLSDGLLRLARSDGKDLELQRLPLSVVAQAAIERVKDAAAHKRIAIGSHDVPVTVLGHENSLIEAVVVLLDNAIKYSEPKSKIELVVKKHAKVGELAVTDHGRGIKAEDLPHIFDRFYRADKSRSNTDVEGHGLGLSIAKKIVEIHDGHIDVTSQPGSGTVFSIKLPLD